MRPLYVGRLTEEETTVLKAGLRSPSAFTVRRCQILLKSARGQTAIQIAKELDCSDQTVRDAITAYHQEGLDCIREKSHARHDQEPPINEAGCARLKEIIRLSPRTFDFQTSDWTRPLLAEVLYQEGYTCQGISPSAITATLKRVDVAWRRAKQWFRSPDPHYEHRKKTRSGASNVRSVYEVAEHSTNNYYDLPLHLIWGNIFHRRVAAQFRGCLQFN